MGCMHCLYGRYMYLTWIFAKTWIWIEPPLITRVLLLMHTHFSITKYSIIHWHYDILKIKPEINYLSVESLILLIILILYSFEWVFNWTSYVPYYDVDFYWINRKLVVIRCLIKNWLKLYFRLDFPYILVPINYWIFSHWKVYVCINTNLHLRINARKIHVIIR